MKKTLIGLVVSALALPIIITIIESDAKAAVVNSSHLKHVKFKIVDEGTGEPLRNRELNICQFVYFKLKPGAPSPYLDKGADWFITSIKTDGQGIFFLDLSKIEASKIVVKPGSPYNIIRFERSSNIAQTKSADHIRVVQFKPGTTQVVSNMIYDLKRKIVKTISIAGEVQEKPYEEIVLAAKKGYLQALIRGDLRTVQKLLVNDPSLISTIDNKSGKRSSGLPALHLAIKYGHAEIVELLLSKGAKPNESIHGHGSVHVAAENGHANLIKILVEYGADINGGKNGFRHPPLCYASGAQVAEALIANGADVNWRDERRATPLHSIAVYGITTAAEVLLAHGADINAKDDSGWTPLHGAAHWCQKEMIELLIAKGGDINAKDRRGATALNRVVTGDRRTETDRKATAELLVSHGADFTIYDVVWVGDMTRVRKLLEDNPSLANDTSNAYKEPVLFFAMREGHSAIAELLLDNGAKLNVMGRHKEPPLHAASHAGHKNVVVLLLRKGADVNQKGAHGELALHWAAAKGHSETVQILVEAGTEVNTGTDKQRMDMNAIVETDADVILEWLKFLASREKQKQARAVGSSLQIMGPIRLAFAAGDTALHSASQWGHKRIAEILLANGADVNVTNRWGQTPLHYAVVFRHEDAVKALLNAGANPNARMLDGSTAHDLASKVKDTEPANL